MGLTHRLGSGTVQYTCRNDLTAINRYIDSFHKRTELTYVVRKVAGIIRNKSVTQAMSHAWTEDKTQQLLQYYDN